MKLERWSVVQAVAVAEGEESAPVRIASEQRRLADDDEQLLRAGDGDIEATRLQDKALILAQIVLIQPASARSNRREDDDSILSALQRLDRSDVDRVQSELSQRLTRPPDRLSVVQPLKSGSA